MSLHDTTQNTPYGYCKCGCGNLAPIAKDSSKKYGWVKGQPVNYIRGHSGRKPDNLGLVALCQCGCGEPTPIAKRTSSERGYTKGEPVRFIRGHYARTIGKQPIADRFWPHVQTQDSGCQYWTSTVNERGYGVIWNENRMQLAHRVSYEIHYGPIPDTLFVLHKCDNPPCVNPAHLFLGTHQDNMDDMAAKDRPRGRYAKTKK